MTQRAAAWWLVAAIAGCNPPQPPVDAAALVDAGSDAGADAGVGIAVSIETMQDETCVLTRDARAICWGATFSGTRVFDAPVDEVRVGLHSVCIRRGSTVSCTPPSTVGDFPITHTPSDAMTTSAASANSGCGVSSVGDVVCWPTATSTVASGVAGASVVRMDVTDDACALVGQQAICWRVLVPGPIVRTLPQPVVGISLSTDARCGIAASNGSVVCDVGQCDSSTNCTDRNDWATRVGLGPPGPFVQIEQSAGAFMMCGLDAAGAVSCWGEAADSFLAPSAPTGARFRDFGVGDTFACGVSLDDRVLCWGADTRHQGVLDIPVELR